MLGEAGVTVAVLLCDADVIIVVQTNNAEHTLGTAELRNESEITQRALSVRQRERCDKLEAKFLRCLSPNRRHVVERVHAA